jgi:hypothetical protein
MHIGSKLQGQQSSHEECDAKAAGKSTEREKEREREIPCYWRKVVGQNELEVDPHRLVEVALRGAVWALESSTRTETE